VTRSVAPSGCSCNLVGDDGLVNYAVAGPAPLTGAGCHGFRHSIRWWTTLSLSMVRAVTTPETGGLGGWLARLT